MSSPHATTPTALGTFFAYPADAVGNVAQYWRDAGGEYVRMTGACKRAFLATIEALIERAVVPANFGNVPGSVNTLTSATFDFSGMSAPFSLVNLGPWATGSGRAGIGSLLERGLPYGVWSRLVTLVWALFRTTRTEIGMYSVVLSWQGSMLDVSSSGFVESDDVVWSGIWVRDWGSAEAYDGVEDSSYEGPRILPWGPFLGASSGSAVESELQSMMDSISSGVSIGGGSGELHFVEDALDVTPDVMRMDGETPGNWFTQSASTPVGGVTLRRSAAAWGVLQAMLAQMIHTHLSFEFTITFEHTEETREVLREVFWDRDTKNWACAEIDDSTTTTMTYLDNQIVHQRGYGAGGGIAAEVTLDFRVDNTSADDLDEFALDTLPADIGPDGPYAVIGRAFLKFSVARVVTDQVWSKSASRKYASGVDDVTVGDEYPAQSLRGYVDEYGPVHFAASLSYTNSTTQEEWSKYSLAQQSGDADLSEPVADYAGWLMTQVPAVTIPPISPFDQSAFNAAVSRYWNNMIAVYPTVPNVVVNGVPKYFPIGIYGYSGGLQRIELDPTDNIWKGQIRIGYGDLDSVFPQEGAEVYGFVARCAPKAIAGYKWNFKAMPITTS